MSEDQSDTGWEARLADRRRRYLLYCLHLYAPPLKLADVAHQLTVWETGEPADDRLDERLRIYMSLYHDHLPALIDSRLVDYRQDEDVVGPGPATERIEPLLKRALRADAADLLRAERAAFDRERDGRAGALR
ncbi:hypothetical protein ACFQPA_09695 [Halomarina halobia]|uniref:DUF7344 domain-containing protein n=1 Tax=Halomarina halobia TaxID=3033386 RepID=A0ABD6ABQ6_9EURY|nr:hypothetical protein [Halomarina sp. PSR21]